MQTVHYSILTNMQGTIARMRNKQSQKKENQMKKRIMLVLMGAMLIGGAELLLASPRVYNRSLASVSSGYCEAPALGAFSDPSAAGVCAAADTKEMCLAGRCQWITGKEGVGTPNDPDTSRDIQSPRQDEESVNSCEAITKPVRGRTWVGTEGGRSWNDSLGKATALALSQCEQKRKEEAKSDPSAKYGKCVVTSSSTLMGGYGRVYGVYTAIRHEEPLSKKERKEAQCELLRQCQMSALSDPGKTEDFLRKLQFMVDSLKCDSRRSIFGS